MLLDVQGLSVSSNGGGRTYRILSDICFNVGEGEVLGIIGESGSGKTTLTRALTNLFPAGRGMQVNGTVRFDGRDLLSTAGEQIRGHRCGPIRYIFQEPASALNPTLRIHTQFRLLERQVDSTTPSSMDRRDEWITESLSRMGIQNPTEVLHSYPHQLSIGMLQRVLVAMAMFGEPRLLIGDEPTSAVDAILRYEILDFLHDRCRNQGMALLLATHDLSIVRTYADRVVVLYAGRIVEMSKKDRFFNKPLHPYSAMLVASAPETFARLKPLPGTEGKPSTEMSASEGCRFSPRCPRVQDDCRIAEPALIPIDEESKVRCPYWK